MAYRWSTWKQTYLSIYRSIDLYSHLLIRQFFCARTDQLYCTCSFKYVIRIKLTGSRPKTLSLFVWMGNMRRSNCPNWIRSCHEPRREITTRILLFIHVIWSYFRDMLVFSHILTNSTDKEDWVNANPWNPAHSTFLMETNFFIWDIR